MPSRPRVFFAVASALLGLLALVPTSAPAQVSVWTHHNDNARSGANLAETRLNTSNVNPAQFGKLFQYPVDAAVFAQPLVISNLTIPGKGTRNVVFIATMNNSVYAFDADDPTKDSGQPIWQVNFNNAATGEIPVPSNNISNSANYNGPFGIMGTPVIDQAGGTIYFVARTFVTGCCYFQRLRALDITTGLERSGSGIAISASVTQQGVNTVFDPKWESQRPAMALANGRVYIAWASQEDIPPYQGWVMAYDSTTLQQVGVFNTSMANQQFAGQAGIWMSGQGPSVDSSGNVYVVTGNGAWDGNFNFAQSVLKLSPSLALLDWFTPDNESISSAQDLDLSSSGFVLIPGTPYGVTGSKEGRFYVLNTAAMGHMVAGNTQIPQVFQASGGVHIHGSPIHWNGPAGKLVYVWPEQDFLKAFAFGSSSFNTTPVTQSTFVAPVGMPGGFLSLSANGGAAGTGIIWANMPLALDSTQRVVSGVLRAFDATDLTRELWNSENSCRDQVGAFGKFVPPTVANGKVYLATFANQVLVYGLLSSQPPPNAGLSGSVSCSSAAVNLTAVGTADWAKWPNYLHKATGGTQISNFAVLGVGTVQTSSSLLRTITWSDGTPVASGSDQAGVSIPSSGFTGRGNGFQITAPADTTRRTLSLFVNATTTAGRLVAHLSDSSAPDYIDSLSGPGSGEYDVVYTISYQATSAGQQLTVSWTEDSDVGTVSLQAAALSTGTPAPLAPTNVAATNGTSATSVTVSWAASANATSYTVFRSTVSGTQGSSVGMTTATSLVDSTVVPGTVYFYSVVATGVGGSSPPSAQVSGSAAGPLQAPTGVSATNGTSATSVTVNWAASTGATSYTVYRSTSSGTQGSSVGSTNTTTLIDSTVVPGTVYFYSVVATGVGGSSAPSAQVSGFAAAPPAAPTSVSASKGTSATTVTVSWTASANASGYTVYRSTSSGTLGSSIGTSTTTSFIDSTPVPSTQYFYSVVATGVGGSSAPSAQASGYAGLPPAGDVTATFAGFAQGVGNAAFQTMTTTTAAVIGGASLEGSSVTSSALTNMTGAGTTDWAKWPNYIHKTTGGGQITTYVKIGAAAVQTYTNDQRILTWSDGTPTASGSDQSGISVSGVGAGFLVTAPADTASRTLSVFAGGSNSGATLIAHLSDGSAPDYVVTQSPVAGTYDLVYTVIYRAASAGQRLSITWMQTSGSGNVRLQGAALK